MATTSEFHGWSKDLGRGHRDSALHVGRLPRRKGVTLYEANGDVTVLAYFKNEAAALRAIELIDYMLGLTDKLRANHGDDTNK